VLNIDVALCLYVSEVAAHRHHAQVLDGELHLSMHGVELPDAHQRLSIPRAIGWQWRRPCAMDSRLMAGSIPTSWVGGTSDSCLERR
jgi:hypothetical protein